ncbi:phosphopantetheine-binding protein [Staphylococcus xylosus]
MNIQTIKEALKRYIPSYMMPHYFIEISDFPLSQNNKVDRLKLKEKLEERMQKKKEKRKNTTKDIEKNLRNIWNEYLFQPVTSNEIDFFEAGGDSLTANQIIAHINVEFNKNLTLKDFFNNPSIREQKEIIEDEIVSEQPRTIKKVNRANNKRK